MNDWMGPGIAICAIILAAFGCAFIAMSTGSNAINPELALKSKATVIVSSYTQSGSNDFKVVSTSDKFEGGIALSNGTDGITCREQVPLGSVTNSLLRGYFESGVRRFRVEVTDEVQQGIVCSGRDGSDYFKYVKFVPLEYSGQPGLVP